VVGRRRKRCRNRQPNRGGREPEAPRAGATAPLPRRSSGKAVVQERNLCARLLHGLRRQDASRRPGGDRAEELEARLGADSGAREGSRARGRGDRGGRPSDAVKPVQAAGERRRTVSASTTSSRNPGNSLLTFATVSASSLPAAAPSRTASSI